MSAYVHTRVAYGLQVLKAPLEVLLVGQDAQAGRAILLVGLRDLHLQPRTCCSSEKTCNNVQTCQNVRSSTVIYIKEKEY